jgi:hypothetical protein
MRNREIMTEIHNHMVSVTSATQSASIVQLHALLGGFKAIPNDKMGRRAGARVIYRYTSIFALDNVPPSAVAVNLN